MPNWCYTEYTIKSSDKEALKDLDKKLSEWMSSEAVESSFGKEWLGNIVINSGMYPENAIDIENNKYPVSVRGQITSYEISEDGDLLIGTETAWCPLDGWLIDLLDKYIPDYDVDYASECNGEFFSNYKEGHIVEYAGCDEKISTRMQEFFGDEERGDEGIDDTKLQAFLEAVLKDFGYQTEGVKIREMIDEVNILDEDLMFHKWQYAGVDYEAGYFSQNPEEDKEM